MIKVGEDTGGDVKWCPKCGCLQDSGGMWFIPRIIKNHVVACNEHLTDPHWPRDLVVSSGR